MEAFIPGTPFQLAKTMGWRCLRGLGGLLPGLLLLSPRATAGRRRDWMLGATWLIATVFMTYGVSNYLDLLSRQAFRHPLFLKSFGWLTVMGLAYQMRFAFLAPVQLAAYAVNTRLLPAICATHFEEQNLRRCVRLGMLRVGLHGVLLPLACAYVFEMHARHLFMRTQR